MGRNRKRLTKGQIKNLLERLQREVTRQECWSCECLQGFLSQLMHDAAESAKPLLAEYKIAPKKIKACQGCESCPAAHIFADYLMRRREKAE